MQCGSFSNVHIALVMIDPDLYDEFDRSFRLIAKILVLRCSFFLSCYLRLGFCETHIDTHQSPEGLCVRKSF